jgi:hypothetical protein
LEVLSLNFNKNQKTTTAFYNKKPERFLQAHFRLFAKKVLATVKG